MTDYRLETRLERYHDLSTRIAYLSDAQLKSLLDRGVDSKTHASASNQTIRIGKTKVFVKRVPVTDLEFEHPFSTKNLFEIPLFYNYGVGSAGLGVYRELAFQIKVTNWVLTGEIDNFPLMYGFRLLPREAEPEPVDMEDHEKYVRYWNGSEAIGRYMLERNRASHELLLILEHFPSTLNDDLRKDLGRIDAHLRELWTAIDFLRAHGVIHFDAHFNNILTDGERPYLADFGLTLDREFDLSAEERAFFAKHTHYDYGELLTSLSWVFPGLLRRLSKTGKKKMRAEFGLHDDVPYWERVSGMLDNLDAIHSHGWMGLDDGFVETVRRFRTPIRLMNAFYEDLHGNDRKDAPFNNVKLKRLLRETGFPGI